MSVLTAVTLLMFVGATSDASAWTRNSTVTTHRGTYTSQSRTKQANRAAELLLREAEGKPREDFIVTIDRSDDQTAFIKVRCQLPPRYFTDYLVAMKLSDGWKIVSKSYRYDLRE